MEQNLLGFLIYNYQVLSLQKIKMLTFFLTRKSNGPLLGGLSLNRGCTDRSFIFVKKIYICIPMRIKETDRLLLPGGGEFQKSVVI